MSQTQTARVVLVVAALVLGLGVSDGQTAQFSGTGITVSDDVNFEGAAVTFRSDVHDLRDVRFNDRISSLRVAPGESWEVCENINYGGRCVIVSGSERDLRPLGLNDAITSLRRVQGRDARRGGDDRDDRGGAGITVSDDVNFQGATVSFRGDMPDLRAVQFNDRISSVQVARGESWEVCENTNYSGRCVVLSGSERDLRAFGLNDAISSMHRVQDRDARDDRGAGFVVPRQPRAEIVLFDRDAYRGAAQSVTEAAPGLGAFTNRARSAQILDGVWELCDEPRWGGRCVRISSSVPDLGRIGISGVASARPLDPRR